MKKRLLISVLILLLIFSAVIQLSAETVYVDELQKAAADGSIVFKNYTGPHNVINTIEEIRGIGQFLGRKITKEPGRYTFFGKYSVIHAVDYSVNVGLDADIFIIDASATVDHITNLRRMISGYLETAYGYEIERADLLAEFITIYNAVHRGDMDYFNEIYKKVVTKNLSSDKAGLALSYLEWPGKSLIVIPLTPQAGDDVISDIQTDILSDKDVIEQLKQEDDKGIEQRQAMVELKDDEVVEERLDIEEKRDVLVEKEQQIIEKKEELETEVEELEDEQTEEAEKQIEEKKQEITELEKEKEIIEEEKKVLDDREKKVEEREEKIVEERKEIAEDQMKLIEGEDKVAATDAAPKAVKIDTVPFLLVRGRDGNYTGQLLLIDSKAGSIVKRSDLDSIRLRGYRYSGDKIISVAGADGGDRIVSLVKIDPETLEVIQSGTVEVYIDSAVIESSGNYYAVVKESGAWKVGRFNSKFELETVSTAEVFPATDIVVRKGEVLAQNPSGNVIKISGDDFISPIF